MHPNDLIAISIEAQKNAYAPYSNYSVGVALLCSDGTVFKGSNVENSSYGLSNCAERTALFSAVAAGKTNFTALAITASDDPVPYPCGACRQVLAEFCEPDFSIYIKSTDGYESTTLGALLPHSFDLGNSADER